MRRTPAPLGTAPPAPKSPAQRAKEVKDEIVRLADEIHASPHSLETYKSHRGEIARLLAQIPEEAKRGAVMGDLRAIAPPNPYVASKGKVTP